jgi:hypothetical protein
MSLPYRSTTPAVLLASSVCVAVILVQPVAAQQSAPAAHKPAPSAPLRHSPYLPVRLPQDSKLYYELMRGIDNLSVRRTGSGSLIRFSYRVTDPAAARQLGEKAATAYLYGEASHALLEVPVMDKIGQLRQTGPLEVGQEYWMLFSNKGELIKAGDRVDVIIGSFHIDGLMVE